MRGANKRDGQSQPDQRNAKRARKNDVDEKLKRATVVEIGTFLRNNDGAADYKIVSGKFPGVKMRQMQNHFDVSNPKELDKCKVSFKDGVDNLDELELAEEEIDEGPPPPYQASGKIVFYSTHKGFGFIKIDEEDRDVFFARENLPPALAEMPLAQMKEQHVNMEVFHDDTSKKPKARNIESTEIMLDENFGEDMGDDNDQYEVEEMRSRDGDLHEDADVENANDKKSREHHGRKSGRIVRFLEEKQFGFIKPEDGGADVYFDRRDLPKGTDTRNGALIDGWVEYEHFSTQEGKHQARKVTMYQGGGRNNNKGGGNYQQQQHKQDYHDYDQTQQQQQQRGGNRQQGGSRGLDNLPSLPPPPFFEAGQILKFDGSKGYGFIRSPAHEKDIFFMKSALPHDSTKGTEVIGMGVFFKFEGDASAENIKPRAEKVILIDDQEFNEHQDAKSWQKDDHAYGGRQQQQQNQSHQQQPRHTPRLPNGVGVQNVQTPAAVVPDVSPHEPAIPLGCGCEAHGFIRFYSAQKGNGFIQCEGLDKDVYFPTAVLPPDFQSKSNQQNMPSLINVEVSFQVKETPKGPRAEIVRPLLRYHPVEKIWLLKRI